LTAQTVNGALVIPLNSVLTTPDGATTVMLAGSDGRAHLKPVKLGIRNGEDVQVLEGLSANDKVVSNGAYGLPDKTKIKIEAPEAPAEGENAKPAAGGSKTATGGSDDK
jgi:multidrug efflux pump subunit AcrA (membrane-fusion protein)